MCEDQEANRIREVITQPSYLGSLVKGVLEELKLVTKKTLQNSDVQKGQSRLFIPIADVRKNLVPFLSLEERRDASLLDLTTKKRKRDDERSSGTDSGVRVVGRNHGGLEVRLITEIIEFREIGMMLTQWDGTLGVVLKGGAEWKDIVPVQNLQTGDSVELLVFRRSATTRGRQGATTVGSQRATTELCFVLRKINCSRGGNTAAVEQAPEARQIINFYGSEQLDLSLSLKPPAPEARQMINIHGSEQLDLSLSLKPPGA